MNDCPKTSHWDLEEEKKGKLADSQSMTNQKWKLIIGHMGTPTNRDRARDELWFYERRRTSEDTVRTLFCKLENPPWISLIKKLFLARGLFKSLYNLDLQHTATVNNTLLSIFVY